MMIVVEVDGAGVRIWKWIWTVKMAERSSLRLLARGVEASRAGERARPLIVNTVERSVHSPGGQSRLDADDLDIPPSELFEQTSMGAQHTLEGTYRRQHVEASASSDA